MRMLLKSCYLDLVFLGNQLGEELSLLEFDNLQDYPNQPYSSAAYGIHPSDIEERRCSYERLYQAYSPQELDTLRRMYLPSYSLVLGNHSGEWSILVSSRTRHSLHACLGMYTMWIVQKCFDSGIRIPGIEELITSSLVSVICHPVEVRAGCCLEADASDSRGFFELWVIPLSVEVELTQKRQIGASSHLLTYPGLIPAEGPSSSSSSSLSSFSCFLLWSLTLTATSLSMTSSSDIKASIRAWLGSTEYFLIKSIVCRSRILRRASSSFVPRYLIRSGYHQKSRKPSQNDKTEHGMEKTVQNQGQSPKMSKSESILKNTIGCNLNPSDGPGKPNSITMKTVKAQS
ncbi:hypothetical protein Tco_1201184 [Tanacetum coccineum]